MNSPKNIRHRNCELPLIHDELTWIGIKILIISVLLFSVVIPSLKAQNDQALILEANQLFTDGKYDESAGLYKQVLEGGKESYELYYNLGNAYYKLNNIAASILNYERAKKLNPGDDDLEFNLSLVNLKTIDKIESIPSLFVSDLAGDLTDLYSYDGWATISVVGIWLCSVFFCLYLVMVIPSLKRVLFWLSLAILVASLITTSFANKKYNIIFQNSEAIVFSPSMVVKSSPRDSGTDLFVLHEGTKIMMLEELGEWSKIKLADGSVGWIPGSAIEII